MNRAVPITIAARAGSKRGGARWGLMARRRCKNRIHPVERGLDRPSWDTVHRRIFILLHPPAAFILSVQFRGAAGEAAYF